VREWLNRAVSKTVVPAMEPWVRIPPSPLSKFPAELSKFITIFNMRTIPVFKTSLFTAIFALAIFLSSFTAKAQDVIDFEQFMGMLSETLPESQLDELSYQLPWNIKVSGYAYGDFSGDGFDDFVISVKEKDETPNKTVDVYFLENVNNETYKLVKKRNYKWREVVLEVAFMVKDGKCFVTNRDDENWYFTSYEIQGGKLVQADKEQYPIEFENAGN
jgi:hypothetical protein